jgi:Dyp-type peroxidase family
MELDLGDIQGNVVPGFNKDHQVFVVVRFRSGEAGRQWLAALQPEIASAKEVETFRVLFKGIKQRREARPSTERDGGALRAANSTWINVAMTFEGLCMLSGSAAGANFPAAFKANRVPGAELPAWHRDVHALLIVAADYPRNLAGEVEHQRTTMLAHGVVEIARFTGGTLPGDLRGHEHFGFKDGGSQPAVVGTTSGTGPPVAAGEFLLGCLDQSGQMSGGGLPAWTMNGSFLTFLQLEQHVAAFWNAMRQQARQFGLSAEDVAGSLVGIKHDAAGTALDAGASPFAHISRANPHQLPQAEAGRHRLIRRGIPYGPPWREGDRDDGSRGLLFLAYYADFGRQFEQVWGRWLNGPEFPVPGAGRDSLIGVVPPPGVTGPLTGFHSTPRWSATALRPASMARPGMKGGSIALRLPAFVTPGYGGCFFAPSISALSILADEVRPNPQSRTNGA